MDLPKCCHGIAALQKRIEGVCSYNTDRACREECKELDLNSSSVVWPKNEDEVVHVG